MTVIFIVGLGLYFFLMALIGYLSSRRVKTMEDYLIAGRSLPFYLAVPTIIATWFGAGSSMGVSGTVYSDGFYGVIPDPFGCSLGLLIAGLFFAVPFRRLRLLTISDLLGKAYGTTFERISTLLVLPFYIGTLASQMVAMGYIFQIVSGASFEVGVIIALFLAFSGQSIFNLMVHSGATLFLSIFVPASAALFWNRANVPAAWCSMTLGSLTWFGFLFFSSGYSGRSEDLLFAASTFGASCSLVSYLSVTWFRVFWNKMRPAYTPA